MEDGRRPITADGAGLTAWAASSGACLPGLVLARPGSALSALPPHGPAVVQAAMLPVRPCLPTFARFPPSGPDWLHEIKHDGYRMLALRDGERVRLVSRYGVIGRMASQPSLRRLRPSRPVTASSTARSSRAAGTGSPISNYFAGASMLTRRSYAPSICSDSMATICGASRSRSARRSWRDCWSTAGQRWR